MNQKEIRDQVEDLIRMKQTFNTSAPALPSIDLQPILDSYYSSDAQNILNNNRTQSLIHQWNRQVGNGLFEGKHVGQLGIVLGKLGIKSYKDLFISNFIPEVSMVSFFGYTTKRSKLIDASLSLINFFNDLASKNLIRAVLNPLTAIELADGRFAVISYIAVDQPNEALVQSMYGHLEFKEGGLPPEFK